MEWTKLKNLIILVLLLVNGFLLVLAGTRWEESVRYDRTALEQTVQVLEKSGIQVDSDAVSPADGLSPTAVERDLDRELQMARALLGKEVQADNRGGGLYLYHEDGGELSIRAGGVLSAVLEGGDRWQAGRLDRHAAGLLEEMGVEAEQTGLAEEGSQTRVRFRQLWNGAPVFTCEVEFLYADGVLKTISGTLIAAGQGTAETGQALTLPTALMRFSEAIVSAGDVCSAVQSMEPGYRGAAQSLAGGMRLTPVWLVTTDTAKYYLDCATGALTRLAE